MKRTSWLIATLAAIGIVGAFVINYVFVETAPEGYTYLEGGGHPYMTAFNISIFLLIVGIWGTLMNETID